MRWVGFDRSEVIGMWEEDSSRISWSPSVYEEGGCMLRGGCWVGRHRGEVFDPFRVSFQGNGVTDLWGGGTCSSH